MEIMQIASTKDSVKASEKVDVTTQEVGFSLYFYHFLYSFLLANYKVGL